MWRCFGSNQPAADLSLMLFYLQHRKERRCIASFASTFASQMLCFIKISYLLSMDGCFLIGWRDGQVLSTAQKRHLDACRGPRKLGIPPEGDQAGAEAEEEEEEDEEEAIAIKASRVSASLHCNSFFFSPFCPFSFFFWHFLVYLQSLWFWFG
jgi:hypothetical protein